MVLRSVGVSPPEEDEVGMAVAARTYGVAIIGTGRISGAHARATQSVAATRLVAASEVDEARGREFAARWGCEVVPEYRTLLERDDVDIVALTLPHWLHCPVAIEAAQAGKHILIEKPMADSLEECDRMIEAARRHRVKLFTAHTEEFMAPNVSARQLIESGEVGQPVMATDTWHKAFGLRSRPAWFLDRQRGGGMWLMNGAHMIDRLTYILNSRVVAVKAFVGTRFNDIKADDAALAYLELANGVPCSIAHTGFRDHPGAGVEQSGGLVEVSCTDAMLRVVDRRDLYRSAPGERRGQWQQIALERIDPIAIEWERFAAAIEADGPEPVTPEHARHIVAAMTACEESSRTGREVVLD
jgi:phthalate 4,5-cis-dihydrodiol dehydrogenase